MSGRLLEIKTQLEALRPQRWEQEEIKSRLEEIEKRLVALKEERVLLEISVRNARKEAAGLFHKKQKQKQGRLEGEYRAMMEEIARLHAEQKDLAWRMKTIGDHAQRYQALLEEYDAVFEELRARLIQQGRGAILQQKEERQRRFFSFREGVNKAGSLVARALQALERAGDAPRRMQIQEEPGARRAYVPPGLGIVGLVSRIALDYGRKEPPPAGTREMLVDEEDWMWQSSQLAKEHAKAAGQTLYALEAPNQLRAEWEDALQAADIILRLNFFDDKEGKAIALLWEQRDRLSLAAERCAQMETEIFYEIENILLESEQ